MLGSRSTSLGVCRTTVCTTHTHTGCASHKLHGAERKIVKEDKVVGHVHACQFVLGIQNRRAALLGALREVIDHELVIHAGEPPPEANDKRASLPRECTNQVLVPISSLVQA